MSQWAETSHMHLMEGAAKREIARRLVLDVKTVRKAIGRQDAPSERRTPKRARVLDPWRERSVDLLRSVPRITAKRIGRPLGEQGARVRKRALRGYSLAPQRAAAAGLPRLPAASWAAGASAAGAGHRSSPSGPQSSEAERGGSETGWKAA